MSWLSRVRSGIPFLPKRQSADNLWHKCRKCESMVFTKEWEENLFCCPRCDHHDRIGPKPRFEQIFDGGKHERIASPDVREDPLRFRDTKRYTERLKAARKAWANGFFVVPGIRPAEGSSADQKRVMTPRKAMDAGASILVIGRPVTGAADPDEALRAIAATL